MYLPWEPEKLQADVFLSVGPPPILLADVFNPTPTRQGRNQPLYERHVTKSGRNRVKVL